MLKYILLFTLFFAPLAGAYAQTSAQQAQLAAYLGERDISREELLARLRLEGIDVLNASQAELLALRPRIEAVIADLEAEKIRQTEVVEQVAAEAAEDIEKAIDDGATVEEAIGEVTTEQANESAPASRIYGHQIFRNKSLQVYRTTENATTPDSYPLKPGDEIAVTIFGASQTDFILRVDDQGFVKLPNTLRISVGGMSIGKARVLLANRLRQSYTFRDGQLSIRIQAARTINVNIFGEVENNGGFNISSLNTGFNALVAAGGPTDKGTVRNIQLVQGDQETILDVYDFLQSPTQETAFFIQDNATIHVPLAEKIVTLQGGVNRPLRYELKEGETLSDLIAFAGGLRPRAEAQSIQVTRYVSGQLELINVDLAKEPNFVLRNEDIINIPIIENPVENFVTIDGAVLLPGRYAFGNGITVGELIESGRLRPGARTDAAFLFRTNEDGTKRLERLNLGANAGAKKVELQRGDRLQILQSAAFTDQSTFTVEGAVRNETVTFPFPQDGALTLEEAVLLAGGTTPNAAPEVMLIRTETSNRENQTYERLDLRTDGQFSLTPLDRIIVYPQERYSDPSTVTVSGAVRQPGEYRYSPSLSFEDLIYLSGGYQLSADQSRIEVFRLLLSGGEPTRTLVETIDAASSSGFVLQPFDEIVVRSIAEFETIQNVVVSGEVRYPGTYALLKDNERLSDLIERAGGLTEAAFAAGATLYRPDGDAGYVVLDLDEVVADQNDPANMVLLAADTLHVPKKDELVTIFTRGTQADRFGRDSTTIDGALKVAYQGDYPADWYIDNYAGGFSNDARKRWTTVEYASGRIKETAHFLLSERYPKVLPGASIRVGLKPPKVQKQRREERFDWIGLAQVIAGVATTITTFILLRE